MKVFHRDGKPHLLWGFHELAWSFRTEGVEYPIWDAQGKEIGSIRSQKRAGSIELPEGAKYLLERYFSNKGYPHHALYRLPELEIIAKFDRDTDLDDIQVLNVPEPIKDFLMRDLYE